MEVITEMKNQNEWRQGHRKQQQQQNTTSKSHFVIYPDNCRKLKIFVDGEKSKDQIVF